jgi:hypothetical protein
VAPLAMGSNGGTARCVLVSTSVRLLTEIGLGVGVGVGLGVAVGAGVGVGVGFGVGVGLGVGVGVFRRQDPQPQPARAGERVKKLTAKNTARTTISDRPER